MTRLAVSSLTRSLVLGFSARDAVAGWTRAAAATSRSVAGRSDMAIVLALPPPSGNPSGFPEIRGASPGSLPVFQPTARKASYASISGVLTLINVRAGIWSGAAGRGDDDDPRAARPAGGARRGEGGPGPGHLPA